MYAVLLGIGMGVGTSLLQAHLDLPWPALVDAASPWLTTAFVAGALATRMPVAAQDPRPAAHSSRSRAYS